MADPWRFQQIRHDAPRLVLPIPPSANHRSIRTPRGGVALTPKTREWRETAAILIRQWAIHVGWQNRPTKVWVDYWVAFRVSPERKPQDVVNLTKDLCDIAIGIIYPDDVWALARAQNWWVDPNNPRMEVIFTAEGGPHA